MEQAGQLSMEALCQRTGLLSHGSMGLQCLSPKQSTSMPRGSRSSSASHALAERSRLSAICPHNGYQHAPVFQLPSSPALHENRKQQYLEEQLQRGVGVKDHATGGECGRGRAGSFGGRNALQMRTTLRAQAFQDQVNDIDSMLRDLKQTRNHGEQAVHATQTGGGSSSSKAVSKAPTMTRTPSNQLPREKSDEGAGLGRATSEILIRRGSATGHAPQDVPMLTYKCGKDKVGLVDVKRLQQRCKFMGQGHSVSRFLEHERDRDRQRRFATAAKADLANRLDAAKTSGVPMPSTQSYDDRLFQAQQRKFENDCHTLLHKIERSRAAFPEATEPEAAKRIAYDAALVEWQVYS